MPLRSLRARIVLLLLASSTLGALVFAYVAVRQFDDYERGQALKGLAHEANTLSASGMAQAKRLIPSLLLGLLFALLASLFLGRRVTRPVRELSAASERIAAGVYDIDLRTHGRDELGMLAARFQLMARKL